MGEQCLAELPLHVGQGRWRAHAAVIDHDPAYQTRRVRQYFRDFGRIARLGRAGKGERLQYGDERRRVVSPYQALGLRIGCCGVEGGGRQDDSLLKEFGPFIELDRMEVAEPPQGQLTKSSELVRVMTSEPRWREAGIRLLKFDERAGRLRRAREGQVGPADTRRAVLRQDSGSQR